MQVQQQVETKLTDALAPKLLQVVNESHMHAVPPNSETHFKVLVVSEAFDGLRAVRRHQLIYAALADELAGPIHALALHTHTPAEWQASGQALPDSPNCMGSGK